MQMAARCGIRDVLLFLVLAVPAALPLQAAQPSSGTLEQAGGTVQWTGGPVTGLNVSPQTCVQDVSCDSFSADLIIPLDKVGRLRVRVDWASAGDDLDLFLVDAAGQQWASSTSAGTTREEILVEALPPGTYRIVTVSAGAAAMPYRGRTTLEAITDPPADAAPMSTVRFAEPTMVDFSATSGEPFIRVDDQDRVFVSAPFGVSTTLSLLWKSVDGGRSFLSLGTPGVRDAVTGPGGGDTHQDFDGRGRLYYVDLSAACVTAAVSLDGGETFPPERTSSVVCASAENPEAATDDRQWVAGFGDGLGYVTFRNFAGDAFWLFKTRDGGLSWDSGRQLGLVDQSGPLQIDKQKRTVTVGGGSRQAVLLYQIFYRGTNLRLFRVTDLDDGSPLVVEDLSIADPGVSVSNVFPVLAVDRAGNLYAVWSQSASVIYMATSTDHGTTWSQPVRVSKIPGTNIMPWVVAGDPGKVDVVWYHSPLAGNPDVAESAWEIVMAQSLAALQPSPAFAMARMSNNIVHRGEICLQGLLCDVLGRDRSFLEFPSIHLDSRGMAFVTYNDNTNQVEAPYVMVARQIAGPGLYQMGPSDAVTITRPAPLGVVTRPSTTARGTHRLLPANFDRDEAGDARFPGHGPARGNNIPALDLLSAHLSADNQALIAKIRIADLSTAALLTAPALAGGDGLLYLVQWDFGEEVRWVGAEVRAGRPVFWTGTLGLVQTTSKKFITYNPDLVASLQVTGDLGGAEPGVLTLRVPRNAVGSPASGARLFSVTAYAFSERGPLVPLGTGAVPDPTSLPVRIDASGAFGYAVGESLHYDGAVEVSVDDSGFSAPLFASLALDGTWSLVLDTSTLTSGSHKLYVRQRPEGGYPSKTESVSFVVP